MSAPELFSFTQHDDVLEGTALQQMLETIV